MEKSKFAKLLFLTSSIGLSSFANDYIVCKSTSKGLLQCEDGIYKPTGESAEAISKYKIETQPQRRLTENEIDKMIPSISGPKVKNRISSLLKEVTTDSNFNSQAIIGKIILSKSIDSVRADSLVKELKSDENISKLKPEELLNKIAKSKVLV